MIRSSDSSTIDSGRRVAVVLEQNTPATSKPPKVSEVSTELASALTEVDRLGALCGKSSVAPAYQARQQAYNLVYELTGTVREIGLNVLGTPVPFDKLLARPGSNAPAGVLLSAAKQLLEDAVKPYSAFFAASGFSAQQFQNSIAVLEATNKRYEDAEQKRRSFYKDFREAVKRVRRAVKGVGAVLRAVYGAKHKVAQLYREAKRIRQLHGSKASSRSKSSGGTVAPAQPTEVTKVA